MARLYSVTGIIHRVHIIRMRYVLYNYLECMYSTSASLQAFIVQCTIGVIQVLVQARDEIHG